jgi:hypothetical protein
MNLPNSPDSLLARIDAITEKPSTIIMTQDPNAAPQQSTQSAETDPRFRIQIFGPGEGDHAEFMMRKKHTIRKVLAGACKSFDIDPSL